MGNVLLFQVDSLTKTHFSSTPGVALELFHEEAALLERLGNPAQPPDAIVLGRAAHDGAGVAKMLRARDALVSILHLGSDAPGDTANVRTLATAGPDHVTTGLEACIAETRARRTNAALEHAQGVRDALLSLVAHDIRAPLSVIGGAMSELTHPTVGVLNDEQRMLLALMKRGIERLGRLATNLSYVSKLEAGQLELARRRADLCGVVRDAARKMQESEDFGSIELLIEAEKPVAVDVDPEKFAVVVGNLVSNALRFARRRIVLRVAVLGDAARVEVEDDGSGIPAGDDDIFERIHLAKKRKGLAGSGLGLSIVRGITLAHGGWATAENLKVDGKTAGARFVVGLPMPRP